MVPCGSQGYHLSEGGGTVNSLEATHIAGPVRGVTGRGKLPEAQGYLKSQNAHWSRLLNWPDIIVVFSISG